MRIRQTVARVAGAGALAGALSAGVLAAPVSAVPGQTSHGTTTLAYVGSDPTPNDPTTFSLQPPQGVGVPGNCPFDINAVFAITGNFENHMHPNNNGFWAGGTGNGDATLTDPGNASFTGPYNGQATAWGGFGTNQSLTDPTGQSEYGQTFHFHGTNGVGHSLDVVFDYHLTFNNSGTITSYKKLDFACS